MDPLMVALRVLHIGSGVLWVGAAWMFYLFVSPTLRAMGPDTERSFMGYILRQRRLGHTILGATVVTVAAGATMLVIDIGRFGGLQAWLGTSFGVGITIGALAAIASFVLGPLVIVPATNRMEKIATEVEASGAPPTAEQQSQLVALSSRLQRVLAWDSALLLVAVVLMAISRYL